MQSDRTEAILEKRNEQKIQSVETYLKRLAAVIAAKGGLIKY